MAAAWTSEEDSVNVDVLDGTQEAGELIHEEGGEADLTKEVAKDAALPLAVFDRQVVLYRDADSVLHCSHRNVTFDEICEDHLHLSFPWETTAKVLRTRVIQTVHGRFLTVILADGKGMKMDAICYEELVDHFNILLQAGTVYSFRRIGFEPADLPLPFTLAVPSNYIAVLRTHTEVQLAGPQTVIPRLPQAFLRFSTVYCLRNNMLADVIGLVVYVSKLMHKRYGDTYVHNLPILDIAVINTRQEIIFIRIWVRQVRQQGALWRHAEYGLWTLAATMLEKKQAEGGLSTTDESQIVLQEPNYELDEFRATLDSAPRALWFQVRRAVKLRKRQAKDDNLVESTL